ncbi:hypothetical protein C8Q72DRAFT_793532 [Fomitopsis betulina]|nr:hypothetical protein C8Q72DRAFT_793532 [Fomitopsis betulina]
MITLALTALAVTLVTSAVATPIGARDFAGPPGLAEFQLTTIPNGDNDTYSGWFVHAFHTGAGTNAAVLLPRQSGSPTWQFDSTTGDVYDLTELGAEYPWSLGLANETPYESDAPAGYKLVTIDVGLSNTGFSFDGDVLPNPAGYGTMAACYVNGTSPYWSQGPQVQLLWRAEDVAKGACADVLLKAVPVV